MGHYSPGKKPIFSEGNTFKSIIPLDGVLLDGYTKTNDAVTDTVSGAIKERLKYRDTADAERRGTIAIGC